MEVQSIAEPTWKKMGEEVYSNIMFLKKDPLYKSVKPYRLRYLPDDDLQQSNVKSEPHTVTIASMRPIEHKLLLDVNGFETLRMKTKLTRAEFLNSPHLVRALYIEELRDALTRHLGAKHIHFLDYVLRQRHSDFPLSSGEEYKYSQPTTSAHVDVSNDSTRSILSNVFGDFAEEIAKGRYQCITIWKPLEVVRDWPLALCDAQTVKPKELVTADILYPAFAGENRMLQYADEQRWYYLPEQDPSELLLFKASDSDPKYQNSACPHASFQLPGDTKNVARESIDVRALVMYADLEYPEGKGWSI